jgi:hypothetical protein
MGSPSNRRRVLVPAAGLAALAIGIAVGLSATGATAPSSPPERHATTPRARAHLVQDAAAARRTARRFVRAAINGAPPAGGWQRLTTPKLAHRLHATAGRRPAGSSRWRIGQVAVALRADSAGRTTALVNAGLRAGAGGQPAAVAWRLTLVRNGARWRVSQVRR